MVPILQIHTQIPPIQISSLEKYRTQDHGAGGRPIGNLTTIHTNIPPITVTVLAIAL